MKLFPITSQYYYNYTPIYISVHVYLHFYPLSASFLILCVILVHIGLFFAVVNLCSWCSFGGFLFWEVYGIWVWMVVGVWGGWWMLGRGCGCGVCVGGEASLKQVLSNIYYLFMSFNDWHLADMHKLIRHFLLS